MMRFQVTHRIAAIGLLGIAGLGVVGAIYLAGNASQEKQRVVAAQARTIADASARLDRDLLESRRAEKDFLLRSDEKYIARHAELQATIAKTFLSLQEAAGTTALAQTAASVRAGYDGYLKHFRALVEARRALGLNENAGLEGTLRKSVHAVESVLTEFDTPRLAVTMLRMRRHEKDFMMRRDLRYVQEMKKRAGEFAPALAASTIPAAARDDITKKMAAYQQDFLSWAATAQKAGQEQIAMSQAYAVIEPVIDRLQKDAETVRTEAEAAEAASRTATRQQMQLAFLLVALAVGALALLIGRSVSRPLRAMARAMGLLAGGDFAVVLPGLGRKDEIGDMAQAVEAFKVKAVENARHEAAAKEAEAHAAAAVRKAEMHRLADSFEGVVGIIVGTVSSASTQLEAAAATLTRSATTTQQLSGSVAAASEQASANVQSVASATEQMMASVHEISRQVLESSTIAGQAVQQAARTDARIGELSQAASRIGDVVKLITSVAEQTNLLALNATIEAARAGEAGRGFAVVAQEVKALAAQTAKATEEIGAQIAGMQAATGESVDAIKEIGGTIGRVAEIAASISSAVEQQGATNQEIARNVQQAAQGTLEVAANIADVSLGAIQTGSASAQVFASAQSLARESGQLRIEVEKFLATVRAA